MGLLRTPPALAVITVMLAAPMPAAAQQEPTWMRGLDELMSLQVTSVSKKEQRVADTSAAVFVLTRDDIRRSGMRTAADLLRLVPGLSVAQIDGNKWAVAARGLGGRQSHKLLVMVDGRSIYTPSFAGVLWDEVDVPVQAIERIEVIRGPGASIWGANAVNGVINIITRGPSIRRDTVSAGIGSVDFRSLLHDGRLGNRIGYRLFAEITGFDKLRRSSRLTGRARDPHSGPLSCGRQHQPVVGCSLRAPPPSAVSARDPALRALLPPPSPPPLPPLSPASGWRGIADTDELVSTSEGNRDRGRLPGSL